MNNDSEKTIDHHEGDESCFTFAQCSTNNNEGEQSHEISNQELTNLPEPQPETNNQEFPNDLPPLPDSPPMSDQEVSNFLPDSPPISHKPSPEGPQNPRTMVIRRWENSQMRMGSINYIVGKRATGKHSLFRFLYSLIHSQIEELFVFTHQDYRFQSLTVKSHILNNLEKLPALISYFKDTPRTKRAVVFETHDVQQYLNSEQSGFAELFLNGRHLGVTAFFITAYPYSMKPMLRVNIDNVFIFHEYNQSIIQKLFMQHGGLAPSISDFKSILQQIAHIRYNCMVIDNCKNQFQWIKADLIDDKLLSKKLKEIPSKYLEPRKTTIEIEISELDDMKRQLKQLKSLCSQLLDRFNNLGI